MNSILFRSSMTFIAVVFSFANLFAHGNDEDPDVTLHVSNQYSSCFIDLHSNLSQSQFNRFSREASDVIYYRTMLGKPLSKGGFELALGLFKTPFDQTSGAWNNTFSHPEEDHWLGTEINIPNLSLKYGISKKWQVGGYFTKDPLANYGFLGLDLLYSPTLENTRGLRTTFRANYTTMLFVDDMALHTGGLGYHISKTFFTCLTPYVGLAVNGNLGIETTNEVALKNSFSISPRAIAGISFDKKFFHVAVQADMSSLFSYSVNFGFRFLGEK